MRYNRNWLTGNADENRCGGSPDYDLRMRFTGVAKGEHPLNEEADQHDIVLANLPAGQTERRIAFAIALAFLGIGAIVVP